MEDFNPAFDPYYRREMPRDLFNEAKLLKCLGRLLLMHVDRHLSDECKFSHVEPRQGFVIGQNPGDGSLGCANLHMWRIQALPDRKRVRTYVDLYTPLNSREAYPLVFSVHDEEAFVFDETGKMTPEFHELFGYKDRHGQEG